MQSIIKNKLISSIVFLILGILLLIAHLLTVKLIVYILGGVLLLNALVRLIAFFVAKKEDRVPLSLMLGIVSAAIGLFFVLAPMVVIKVMAVIFGVMLILNSLLDLVIAVRLPAGKACAVVLALIGLAVGVMIVINPDTFANIMTYIIGAAFIYESIVGIVTTILARKTAKSNLLNK